MTFDRVLVHAPFPRALAGHFMPAKPVVPAFTSISATNAGQNTPLVTVPRPGTIRATDPLNQGYSASSILLSSPVTPVEVDRLEFLL